MYLLPVQWKYSEKRTTTVTDEKLGTHHCMAGTPRHQKQQNLSLTLGSTFMGKNTAPTVRRIGMWASCNKPAVQPKRHKASFSDGLLSNQSATSLVSVMALWPASKAVIGGDVKTWQ
jgi:hypothetical protein